MLHCQLVDFVQPFGYLGFTHWAVCPVLFGVVQKFHHTKSGQKETHTHILFMSGCKNKTKKSVSLTKEEEIKCYLLAKLMVTLRGYRCSH